MKSAVVIGGSNGIGLAITKQLLGQGIHVNVLDLVEPVIEDENLTYYPCNLMDFDEDFVARFATDPEVCILMMTAGLGRVADFEDLDTVEIKKIMQINATAQIAILRLFYNRIKAKERFYCGIMGSIAGHVSSPMLSVYSASKAAVCRAVESINIEMEASGTDNRILDVSPGSIEGTKFNGGENNISLIEELAADIINRMFLGETLYIPKMEIYGGVLERYHKDPHGFGLSSYEYKKKSGRIRNSSTIVGYLSGTFDLFHVGHLNLIRRAKAQCDYLIVGVHPDASHKNKQTFIPFEERKEVVGAVKYVDKVVTSCPEDDEAWRLHHYDKLFVGSDYKGTPRFNRYEEYFKDKGVEIVYFPYTTTTNSTMIRDKISKKTEEA
jgi:glycerol-3-phosphate cytidylyltransferase